MIEVSYQYFAAFGVFSCSIGYVIGILVAHRIWKRKMTELVENITKEQGEQWKRYVAGEPLTRRPIRN